MTLEISSLLEEKGSKLIIENLINNYFAETIENNLFKNVNGDTDLFNFIVSIENPKTALLNYINNSLKNSEDFNRLKGKIDFYNINILWSSILKQLEATGLTCTETSTTEGKEYLEISFESYFDFKFFQ